MFIKCRKADINICSLQLPEGYREEDIQFIVSSEGITLTPDLYQLLSLYNKDTCELTITCVINETFAKKYLTGGMRDIWAYVPRCMIQQTPREDKQLAKKTTIPK